MYTIETHAIRTRHDIRNQERDNARCFLCGRPAHYWTQAEHRTNRDAAPGSGSIDHCQAHRGAARVKATAESRGHLFGIVLIPHGFSIAASWACIETWPVAHWSGQVQRVFGRAFLECGAVENVSALAHDGYPLTWIAD
jgi:hypothetical protein